MLSKLPTDPTLSVAVTSQNEVAVRFAPQSLPLAYPGPVPSTYTVRGSHSVFLSFVVTVTSGGRTVYMVHDSLRHHVLGHLRMFDMTSSAGGNPCDSGKTVILRGPRL